VVTTREIADAFDNGMEYFNTYGGNPVSCAIGKAVLEVIEQEELQQRALEVGGALRSGLEELADHYDLIGDVRGHGLFLGFELVDDRDTLQPAAARASRLVERMRHWGFLLSTDGPLHNVIKIKPPLQISEGDAYQTLQALDEVLSESALQPGAGMGR
jgi:4-aminobutyrate aminotransferase-like enzyme